MLFEDPAVDVAAPGDEFLVREEEADFLDAVVDAVRAVDQVAADLQAEVAADASRRL